MGLRDRNFPSLREIWSRGPVHRHIRAKRQVVAGRRAAVRYVPPVLPCLVLPARLRCAAAAAEPEIAESNTSDVSVPAGAGGSRSFVAHEPPRVGVRGARSSLSHGGQGATTPWRTARAGQAGLSCAQSTDYRVPGSRDTARIRSGRSESQATSCADRAPLHAQVTATEPTFLNVLDMHSSAREQWNDRSTWRNQSWLMSPRPGSAACRS